MLGINAAWIVVGVLILLAGLFEWWQSTHEVLLFRELRWIVKFDDDQVSRPATTLTRTFHDISVSSRVNPESVTFGLLTPLLTEISPIRSQPTYVGPTSGWATGDTTVSRKFASAS